MHTSRVDWGSKSHYLIADSSGRSVLVEYYDGNLQTVETDTDYQIASNFIAYKGLNIGESFTEFERYDTVKATINENFGILSERQAISLLVDIGVMDGDTDKLQWSVIYNLTTGDEQIFAHRNMDNVIPFHIKMEK